MSDAANLHWELSQLALFRAFEPRDIEAVAHKAVVQVFKPRQPLFHEGDPGGSMYVLLSGRVKVTTFSAEGKECILSFAGPGEVLGEITLLDEAPRTASASALELTRTVHVARRDLLPVLERSPAAALHIVQVLCERLRATSLLVEDAAFLASGPRLARALLRLSPRADQPVRLAQATLGSHVGLMRESVNRQLRIWEEDGVIRSAADGVMILRRDLLENIAELA